MLKISSPWGESEDEGVLNYGLKRIDDKSLLNKIIIKYNQSLKF